MKRCEISQKYVHQEMLAGCKMEFKTKTIIEKND
jgi:hypothetical protein